MDKATTKTVQSTNSKLKLSGITVYGLTIAVSILLLLAEPLWLKMQDAIFPLIILLLVGSAMFSYSIASKKSSKNMRVLGTIALAVLFSFVAFIAIALVAWFIAVYHANA